MKKSQILAALALAFALGVVAPVASVNAYVLDGDQDSRAQFGKEVVALNKKVNALGDCSEGSKNLYDEYVALYNAVNTADANNSAAEKAYASALKDARDELAATMSSTKGDAPLGFVHLIANAARTAEAAEEADKTSGNATIIATWKAYNGTDVNAYTDYTALVNYAKDLYNGLNAYANKYAAQATADVAAEPTDTVLQNAVNAARAAANALYTDSTTGAIVVAEEAAAEAKSDLEGVYEQGRVAINNELATSFKQVTTGNTTYTAAKAAALAMPKYGNFAVVIEQQAEIAKVIREGAGAEGYTLAEGRAALAQQEQNIANFCSTDLSNDDVVTPTPEKPADKEDDKKLPNAGNTGTIAGADATAKATVSIMAAIASVATAAFVAIRKIAAGKKA